MDHSTADLSRRSFIDIHSLKFWNAICPKEVKEDFFQERLPVFSESPFPWNQSINRQVALWVGDITLLNCEAIVNTTNERINDSGPISQRILCKGGPQFRHFIKEHIRGCRTGDARITKGYDLAARYVIHAVGPKYVTKYHTAAENALYSVYAKVLSLARDHGIRSLALCPINSGTKNRF